MYVYMCIYIYYIYISLNARPIASQESPPWRLGAAGTCAWTGPGAARRSGAGPGLPGVPGVHSHGGSPIAG